MYIWKEIHVHIYIRTWLLMRSIHIRNIANPLECFCCIDPSMHNNPLQFKFALSVVSKFPLRLLFPFVSLPLWLHLRPPLMTKCWRRFWLRPSSRFRTRHTRWITMKVSLHHTNPFCLASHSCPIAWIVHLWKRLPSIYSIAVPLKRLSFLRSS